MSPIIEVDPEAISTAKDDIVTAASGMDDELQDLAAQTDWNSSMLAIHAVLNEITALLATISSRYTTTESAVVRNCGA
jgi:hypothetical protein